MARRHGSVRALALAAIGLALSAAAFARGYDAIGAQKALALAGDFAELKKCQAEGKWKIAEQDGQRVLLAESETAISLEKAPAAPYSVTAWVKLPAKGKAVLTAERNEMGGYQVELWAAGEAIGIRARANGCNLWDQSTYKFREGHGRDSLRYQVRLDPKDLAKRLEHAEGGLKGRADEWKEWGLGTKGEFLEERQAQGIRGLIEANNAQPLASGRWTEVGIDVAQDVLRMWVDGRLVGEARHPVLVKNLTLPFWVRTGTSLSLPAGAQLLSLVVESPREPLGAFLPLDLAGYHNHASAAAAASPTGLIRVRGIPFLLRRTPDGRDDLDVGASAPLETGFGSGNLGSEFQGASGLLRHPARIVLQAPKGWYQNLYLLAYSEKEPETEPIVSFRFFRDENSGTIVDYTCRVPPGDARAPKEAVGSFCVTGPQGKDLWLHVIRVPLDPCLLQSSLEKTFVRDFQIEVTRGLHFTRGYPDPWNYTSLAAGKRSSVHILGMTFEEAPLELWVKAGEAGDVVGNLFVEPELSVLHVTVRNHAARARRATVGVSFYDAQGRMAEVTKEDEIPGHSSVVTRFRLPVREWSNSISWFPREGTYGTCRATVTLKGRDIDLAKHTTLAYLPPDTRKAGWGDSFFGIWSWGAGAGGYAYPVNNEETMRLIWKLGGRWALGIADPPIARHYRITNAYSGLPGIDWAKVPREKWGDELKAKMLEGLRKNRENFPDQDLFLVFGEANLGLKQTFALPGRYYGEPDYELNEAEKKRFDAMFEQAALSGKVLKAIKQEHPEFRNVRIAFGNTSPSFHIEFLKRGLPKDCIDVFGIDIPYFERMPERPPRAVEASQLLYLYDFRKAFGCENIPIIGTEDMYYPGCPGSLSQREQANYYVRCHVLKMALGVSREVSVGMVFSTSGPYGRCHYGAAGFFEVAPEGGGDGNPRQAAVAYATMTRVLDGAKFEKWFPTGSLSTFCLAFSRKFGRSDALALWTLRGRREVKIALGEDLVAQITDAGGNTRPAGAAHGVLEVGVSPSPIWVEGVKASQVKSVRAGEPTDTSSLPRVPDPREGKTPAHPPAGVKPAGGAPALLEDFDQPWTAVAEADKGFEENNFDLPRFKGEMTASIVPAPSGGNAMQIVLQKPAKERKLAPWYAAFVPPKPIPLPGQPTQLGLWVKGSSGWGRIIPQVTDAKGEVWTFIGPKDEWNSDDIRSQSSVNFDGWRYMEIELPSNLPNGWPGPAMAFWKNEKGDRVVDFPLRLTRLYIEQRTHVYYVNEILPVPEPAITIDKIGCTYDDPYAEWHLNKGW